MELDRVAIDGVAIDRVALDTPSCAAQWKAGFHPGQRSFRWTRWPELDSIFPAKC